MKELPTYRPTPHRKHLLVLALTLLTLTAALPAVAQIPTSTKKESYQHRVPITSINSIVPGSNVLLNDDNKTEWVSTKGYTQKYDAYTTWAGSHSVENGVWGEMPQAADKTQYFSFNDGILTYLRPATNNRIITSDNTIKLIQGTKYNVTVHLDADKAGEVTMELGGQSVTKTFGPGDQYVTFDFGAMGNDSDNANCKLDFSLYSGTVNIYSIEVSKDAIVENDFTKLSSWQNATIDGSDPKIATDGLSIEERGTSHVTINNVKLEAGKGYTVKVRIKKDKNAPSGKSLTINLGGWGYGVDARKQIPITDDWSVGEVSFTASQLGYNPEKPQEAPEQVCRLYSKYHDENDAEKEFKGKYCIDYITVIEEGQTEGQTIDFSTNAVGWGYGQTSIESSSEAEKGGNILIVNNTPNHFKIFNDLTDTNIDRSKNYKVKFRLKSTKSGTITFNLRQYGSGVSFNVNQSSDFQDYEISVPSGRIGTDNFGSIYFNDYDGTLVIEKAQIFLDEASQIVSVPFQLSSNQVALPKGKKLSFLVQLESTKNGNVTLQIGDESITKSVTEGYQDIYFDFNEIPLGSEESEGATIRQTIIITSDLKPNEINISNITNQSSTETVVNQLYANWNTDDAKISGNQPTIVNNCLSVQKQDDHKTSHFPAVTGIPISNTKDYTITVRIKKGEYSPSGQDVTINFGDWGNGGTYDKHIRVTDDWSVQTVQFNKSEISKDADEWCRIYAKYGSQEYKGDFYLDYVSVVDNDNSVVDNDNKEYKENFSSFKVLYHEGLDPISESSSEAEDGSMILHVYNSPNHFKILNDLTDTNIPQGENYKVNLRLKSDVDGSLQLNLRNNVGVTFQVSGGNDFKDYEITVPSELVGNKDFCSILCGDYNTSIEIESVTIGRVIPTPIELYNHNLPQGQSSGWEQFCIVKSDQLDAEKGRMFRIITKIKASTGGNFNYVVGSNSGDVPDDKKWENGQIEGVTSEWQEITSYVTAPSNGFVEMRLQPGSYAGKIEIEKVILEPVFDYSGNQDLYKKPVGTDYIEVVLGEPMKSKTDYLFHIGTKMGDDGTSSIYTPATFEILREGDDGKFISLGTCSVGGWQNNSNGYMELYSGEIPDGVTKLRIKCKSNYGEENGEGATLASYDAIDWGKGSMMSLTRFAMYELVELNMEASEEKWAYPLLTRFQVEANGIKYAYPGARLRDMIGVQKGYSNTSEMFGQNISDVASSYWDTTLPYNKESGVVAEGAQNRDYAADGIDHTESPYDCIDLLFPNLSDLRAITLNGKYQLYISMLQGRGTIGNQYPEYRTYTGDLDAKYINKANGFPTEITYQGFKYDEKTGEKDLQGSPKVMNLSPFSEKDPNQDHTRVLSLARFALDVEGDWDGVRITCRENVGDLERMHGDKKRTTVYDSNRYHNVVKEDISNTEIIPDTRMMRLAGLQAYVEIPKINLEKKDDGTEVYDYNLLYNSREDFKNYNLEHTQGIVAAINNVDDYVPAGIDWQDAIKENKPDLEKHNIALPDFNFYDSPFDDPDIPVSTSDGYTGNGKRQRTYTILHEVQMLPGERVDLYPQSDIWDTGKMNKNNTRWDNGTGINYEEQFVRWYDYLTDDAPRFLYFFSDPKSVIKTEKNGFIGGKTLLDHEQRGLGTVASVYFRNEIYNEAKQQLDNLSDKSTFNNKYYYYVPEDGSLRMKDQWVAADFSLTFNTNLAERLSKNSTTWANEGGSKIQEPIINFRHLFHITSGSLFADENMAYATGATTSGKKIGNREYYKNNRRYLTSFAKKDFMIRLEKEMPKDKDTKSSYYYKDYQDGNYKRVRSFKIQTYDASMFNYDALTYNGTPISASNLGGSEIFKPVDRSEFDHLSSTILTDTPEAKWLEDGKKFYRAIGCDANDANPGTYLVRVYGMDEDGNVIQLPKTEGSTVYEPLVIAEYNVTFLDPDLHEASFLKESDLKENTSISDDYYTHTEDYLESHFNKDKKSSMVVNFDNYIYLNNSKYSRFGFFESAKGTNNGTTKEQVGSYLKLPIAWDDSNYGFGYTTRGDYNMFMLANHSVVTPYKDAAKMVDDQAGTFDRLYYNTDGAQKGLFYYVNAASDPGEMAKIQFGTLCTGSTIYVSAWVNEFNNGQEETANVIFNFYANVHKKDDPEKKTIRQDQIHGFVTGYIDRGTETGVSSTNFKDGDQGNWIHVYYTFVPDLNLAEYDPNTEAVDSYTLVLENNCISSKGADYAIDDIRAYVVEPRVEVAQTTPLCNRSKANDIEVEVMIPYRSLYESMKESITGAQIQMQYSILDKKTYDDYIDNEKKNGNEITNQTYEDAFAESVLHYAHDNIIMSSGTDKNKPLSWGTITFHSKFEDYFEKDSDGKIKYDSDGNPIPVNSDLGSEGRIIDDEEMLVFKTKLYTEGKYNDLFIQDHREYYVVIGNLGALNIFDNIPNKPEGKYNADVYPSTKEGDSYVKCSDWPEYDKCLANLYGLGSPCARMTAFKVKGAAEIIVDGVVYGDVDNITCCENQRPVVQVDLYKKDSNGIGVGENLTDEDILRANPYLDWYYGSYEEFMEEQMPNSTTSLWEVLIAFRSQYPDETTWNKEPKGKYTVEMKAYLKKMCEPYEETVTNKAGNTKTVTRTPKVKLYASSFVFPTVTMKDDFGQPLKGSDGKTLLELDVYATAVPIDRNNPENSDEIVICTEPAEVKITVSNTSPDMKNGFASDNISYPEDMDIVPLRLGLKHTDKSSVVGSKWTAPANTEDMDKISIDLTPYQGKETLVMPLRNLVKATNGVTKFKTVSGDPFCYLAETNDPYYRRLGQVKFKARLAASSSPSENGGIATQAETANNYVSDFGLTPRGVVNIDASTGTDYFSNVKITFNTADMKFHEGYYYTFKFPYEEDYSTEGVEIPSVADDIPCHGETYFTIKVVPEYQQWTGNASLNWNNDENWTRVSKSDLLTNSEEPSSLSPGVTEKNRFTVNATYPNTFSYAPLDFTKVIIPAGSTYPQLAARRHSNTATGAASDATTVSVDNGKGSVSYVWAKTSETDPNSNAPKAATAAGNGSGKESVAVGASASNSYHPTLNIQYDMAAATYSGDANVYCRPWYANACDQIHFNSNAEILNQQNLDYKKAWVDMEMTPHRWYTVASPLYGVVAGDMYLPTDLSKKTGSSDQSDQSNSYYEAGRQQTELFKNITYNSDVNDRFAPAVYQRGWDKGSEKVYNINYKAADSTLPGCPQVETVALASTWSHVYNDVADAYTVGAGYSVKTDVTRLPKYADNYSGVDKQNYVKFRFPKADTSYEYFEDKTSGTHQTENEFSRGDKAGKLFEMSGESQSVTLTKAKEGKLFLVGNPFMAHLDMEAFLTANSGVIEPKYWIIEGDNQIAAVIDHNNDLLLSNDGKVTSGSIVYDSSAEGQLAPMQGFFVQAKSAGNNTGGNSITITFTPNMMAVQSYDAENNKTPILKAPAYPDNGQRKTDNTDLIRVSTEESTAIIRLSDTADKGYVASEDVEMIDDSNQHGIRRIYTIAGNMASAINQTPDADGVEVGLMAPTDSVTTVTFNGLALEDYLLYDMQTGEMTQLYDGFSIEMEGAVSGRYFLTSGIDTTEIEDSTIRIEPQGDEVVVTAPAACGPLTVRVFDTLGREVASSEGLDQQTRIRLTPGIYVVDARGADKGRRSAKISLH